MNNAMIVMKKELARVFGDRKLIFSLFILPVIVMFGIYSIMGTMLTKMSDDITEHISKVYIMNAPEGIGNVVEATGYGSTAYIEYLNNDTDADTIEKIKQEILNGSTELFVMFDEDFMESARAYASAEDKIPEVHVFYNTAGNYSSVQS